MGKDGQTGSVEQVLMSLADEAHGRPITNVSPELLAGLFAFWPADAKEGEAGKAELPADSAAILDSYFRAWGVPIRTCENSLELVSRAYDTFVTGLSFVMERFLRAGAAERERILEPLPPDWRLYLQAVATSDVEAARALAKKLQPLSNDCEFPKSLHVDFTKRRQAMKRRLLVEERAPEPALLSCLLSHIPSQKDGRTVAELAQLLHDELGEPRRRLAFRLLRTRGLDWSISDAMLLLNMSDGSKLGAVFRGTDFASTWREELADTAGILFPSREPRGLTKFLSSTLLGTAGLLELGLLRD